MSVEIQRRLTSLIRRERQKIKTGTLGFRILLHPTNLERLRVEDEQHLIDIEKAYDVQLSFRADPVFHLENFKILDAKTGEEMK